MLQSQQHETLSQHCFNVGLALNTMAPNNIALIIYLVGYPVMPRTVRDVDLVMNNGLK